LKLVGNPQLAQPTCVTKNNNDVIAQKTLNLAQRSFKVTHFGTNRQIVCE